MSGDKLRLVRRYKIHRIQTLFPKYVLTRNMYLYAICPVGTQYIT